MSSYHRGKRRASPLVLKNREGAGEISSARNVEKKRRDAEGFS